MQLFTVRMFYCVASLANRSLGIHNPLRYSGICPIITESITKMLHETAAVNAFGVGRRVYSASVFQVPDVHLNINASRLYPLPNFRSPLWPEGCLDKPYCVITSSAFRLLTLCAKARCPRLTDSCGTAPTDCFHRVGPAQPSTESIRYLAVKGAKTKKKKIVRL